MSSTMLCHYRAYGLAIRSAICLPELIAADPGPPACDVVISIEEARDYATATVADRVLVDVNHGCVVIEHPVIGRFRIEGGHSIFVQPFIDPPAALLRMILLGPAFAALLRQRGLLTLHASAVAMRGEAVVFLGDSGAGKSTLAAACASAGHVLIADDVVCIEACRAQPVVFPAFPALKLDASSAAACGIGDWNMQSDAESFGKRYLRAMPCRQPSVPLRRMFVLEQHEHAAVRALEPRQAFLELLRHSYGPRTLQSLHPEGHMTQCAALARSVPLARLMRGQSFECLPFLQRVAEDAVA